uniref:Uncharacterized protein n=1 Tax=viral metagenome TaxID=1070528 RepID=A0A6M3LNG6_9ZZZZ
MLNNKGNGLYHIGESHKLDCGCIVVAEETGYTHYVHPKCQLDNRYHPTLRDYRYENMPTDTVDSIARHSLIC